MQKKNYLIKNKKCTSRKSIEKKNLQFFVINEKFIKNKMIILNLLYRGELDRFILLLNNKKIFTNHNSFIKKGYVTRREHFVYVLDNFITYFIDAFNNIGLIDRVLSLCINCSASNVLLSDKYLYDNAYIDYYINKYNLMIIDNFYNNLFSFKDELIQEIENINLKFDIKNDECVNYFFMILEEICFVNRNNFALLSLFDRVNDDNYDLYLVYFKILFSNYFNNIEFVEAYRLFKKKNNL